MFKYFNKIINRTLKSRLLISFLAIIVFLGVLQAILVYYLIEKDIIQREQEQVNVAIKGAWSIYNGEIETIKKLVTLVASSKIPCQFRESQLGLDYLYIVPAEDKKKLESEIAQFAFRGKEIGGTRIISKLELKLIGGNLYNRTEMEIISTPQAMPITEKILDRAMAIEYAIPIFNEEGNIKEVIYGGKIINRNFDLIDKIHNAVFENKIYDSKPIGTVTVFQDDIRIATNVLDNNGDRAVGTKISKIVYNNVLKHGKSWFARAFVVTHWYLTAYEPIKDINGKIIGILYVGILEKPFSDLARNIFLTFLGIIIMGIILALILSIIIATSISNPITDLLSATTRLSEGKLDYRINVNTSIYELNKLEESFNQMAEKIDQREEKLKILNKTYLDLIGFVSHELLNIVAGTILSIATVSNGYIGEINKKQKKSLDLALENLDYFTATVRNFLDLGRIEKKEFHINKKVISLKEDLIDPALRNFHRTCQLKKLEVINNIETSLKIMGDVNLLKIVINNLLSNGAKYSTEGGRIILNSKILNEHIEIEVYNDGRPISTEEESKLFKKFSRLDNTETKTVQGTGLGLFITREIVEKHGGTIYIKTGTEGNSFIFTIES